uniref:Uncharacterized protein n=1 Tax=Brassica campestris TaxID=3711 RepID=A0A3P6AUQ8_BRACM|nr:unnamed protein product [Brassica rapa]
MHRNFFGPHLHLPVEGFSIQLLIQTAEFIYDCH